jgi:hypothetical protein
MAAITTSVVVSGDEHHNWELEFNTLQYTSQNAIHSHLKVTGVDAQHSTNSSAFAKMR